MLHRVNLATSTCSIRQRVIYPRGPAKHNHAGSHLELGTQLIHEVLQALVLRVI